MEELLAIVKGLNTMSIIGAIICIVLCVVLVAFLKKLVVSFLKKHFPSFPENARDWISKIICLLLVIIFCMLLLKVVGIESSGLTILLVLLIAAVVSVSKMLMESVASGMTVMLQKNYSIGDFITCGDYEGIVKQITFNDTIITAAEGKTIKIPNSCINSDAVAVIRMDTDYYLSVIVPLAHNVDPDEAIEKIYQTALGVEGVLREKEVSVGISEIKALVVEYECGVYCRFEDRYDVTYALNDAMLKLIREKEW